MSQDITLQSVLDARGRTYAMLARMYYREMDEEYLASLKKMRCPVNTGNEDVDEGYRLFHHYLSHLWERSLEDLQRDYLRIFIGANTTGHAAAYPNESVHTSPDRLVMQDARDEVLSIYRANGLEGSDLWKAGEDHIAVELEFMQTMSERSAQAGREGADDTLDALLLTQAHFLQDHLIGWVPFLVNDMLKFAQTDFYRALAYLTRGFLEEDHEFLRSMTDEEEEAAGAAVAMNESVR